MVYISMLRTHRLVAEQRCEQSDHVTSSGLDVVVAVGPAHQQMNLQTIQHTTLCHHATHPQHGRTVPEEYNGIYATKLPKLDLPTDAEYAANLETAKKWL